MFSSTWTVKNAPREQPESRRPLVEFSWFSVPRHLTPLVVSKHTLSLLLSIKQQPQSSQCPTGIQEVFQQSGFPGGWNNAETLQLSADHFWKKCLPVGLLLLGQSWKKNQHNNKPLLQPAAESVGKACSWRGFGKSHRSHFDKRKWTFIIFVGVDVILRGRRVYREKWWNKSNNSTVEWAESISLQSTCGFKGNIIWSACKFRHILGWDFVRLGWDKKYESEDSGVEQNHAR